MNEEKNKIKGPWAVYSFSGLRPSGIGLVTRESEGGSLFIKDYKDSSDECWDSRYVERFVNPEDATKHYLKGIGLSHKLPQVLYRLSKSFPEEFEKLRPEKVRGLCKTLIARANFLLAQSSSKCIESKIPMVLGDDFGEFLYPAG